MARIVVVEDNELNMDLLVRRLVKRGFEVVTAVDGLQALEVTRSSKPDLVLMDMSLPEMDGVEVTRLLRADASLEGLPVIALTAHAQSVDRQRALDAGCDDFDTKPIDLERLLAKIRALLPVQEG
jgi:CheY-like chemotaxis protein